MEFFARKLPVPPHWGKFYHRVQEIIPFADLDITAISPFTIISEDLVEACKDLGIPVRPQFQCLAVDRPSIEFYLHKNVPLEKVLEIPDPEIFGEMHLENSWKMYSDGYKIPSAAAWDIGHRVELSLFYPDASEIKLSIIREGKERKREKKSAFAPLASH